MGIKGQEPPKDGALTGNCSNNSLVLNHKIGLSTLSTNKRWGYPISLQKWRNYYKQRLQKKSRASSHLSYIQSSFSGSRATIHNCTTIIRHQKSTPFLTVIDSQYKFTPFLGGHWPFLRCFIPPPGLAPVLLCAFFTQVLFLSSSLVCWEKADQIP